jgi:hypothetical protein
VNSKSSSSSTTKPRHFLILSSEDEHRTETNNLNNSLVHSSCAETPTTKIRGWAISNPALCSGGTRLYRKPVFLCRRRKNAEIRHNKRRPLPSTPFSICHSESCFEANIRLLNILIIFLLYLSALAIHSPEITRHRVNVMGMHTMLTLCLT